MSAENLFSKPLKVINVGLQSFADDLKTVGVACQQVEPDQRPVLEADAGRGNGHERDSGKE